MSLNPLQVISSVVESGNKIVEKANDNIKESVYNKFKGINRICVLTTEGVMYVVKTNAPTCRVCWREMKRDGFLSVEVNTSNGEKEHLIDSSLVKEMFLGTKPIETI